MLFGGASLENTLFGLAPWVVLLPAIGLVLNLAFGRRIGERGVALVACLATALTFVVSVLQFASLRAHPEGEVLTLAEWIHVGELRVPWAVRIDTLSVTMMLVVSGVGTLIHVYAAGYMHYDVRYKAHASHGPASLAVLSAYRRFFVYLNLFIAAMMILVSADNYLVLFVGWEGVGLCSYLLIGFWFDRNPDGTKGRLNTFAAGKAFITNRVGDFGILVAMFLTFWAFGSVEFDRVFAQADRVSSGLITAITLFMLLGVCGKSAQLPLHVWLPDAMAGPTPVSALIHAATMVTAGVYLVARSAPLFHASPEAAATVAVVGAVTALFAATIAVSQHDIKKVLAYSTISQLGFMVTAVGMGAFAAGMFHLVTHAFFKALLFLGAGSVILAVERGHHPLEEDARARHRRGGHTDSRAAAAGAHAESAREEHQAFDPQDMRVMGGLRRRLPLTFAVYAIGASALAGIPPLAGFFSKDEILADAFGYSAVIYILLTVAAFLTAFYMGRQVWMVFFGESRSHAAGAAVESPPTMTVPLALLALLSVAGGLLNLPGLHHLGSWLEHTLGDLVHAGEFNVQVAVVSTALALAGIFVSWMVYGRKRAGEATEHAVAAPVAVPARAPAWSVDSIYDFLIVTPYERLSAFLANAVDWSLWHDFFHEGLLARGFRALASFLADVIDGRLWHDLFHDRLLDRGFRALAFLAANPIDLGIIDGIANGVARVTRGASGALSRTQTGYVRNYVFAVFIGVVIMLGTLMLLR